MRRRSLILSHVANLPAIDIQPELPAVNRVQQYHVVALPLDFNEPFVLDLSASRVSKRGGACLPFDVPAYECP